MKMATETSRPSRLARLQSLASWGAKFRNYWVLTKPEVNLLVLISTLGGFYLASPGPVEWALLIHTLAGTLLVASGTATLNQYLERDADGQMRRTANRPLPAGRIAPPEALWFGILLAVGGGLYLAMAVNILSSALALCTLASYLLFYTPLKRRSAFCTLVGAFPGAMPPLIGWAGARGALSAEAWALYAILFFWQFPHFLAIAWMYREDYRRAGLHMLPADDRDGVLTTRIIIAHLMALVPISLMPALMGRAGMIYSLGALVFGLLFLHQGVRLAATRSNVLARRVVLASIIYLPLVFGLLMLDKKSL